MSRWYWFLSEILSSLWFRASIYGVGGVITALISIYAGRFMPEDISKTIGADAVDSILHIIASSMLAVTIFSVSTMVSAYSAAATNVTPRATNLLIKDRLSHQALSTFLGTFIFSIVGIIALNAGIYGASGRLVLYVVTVAIVVIIIITLIRWIEYLSRLGRVGETIIRVEEAATDAFEDRLRSPYLGGVPLLSDNDIPPGGITVFPDRVGYIQHIDMNALQKTAESNELKIYVQAMPGDLVDPGLPLAIAAHGTHAEHLKLMQDAFIIGKERSFRQDPRYGMVVLNEIATRALSPAINDAGTAIQVISVGLRLLSLWAGRERYVEENETIKHSRVYAPGLKIDDLFEDCFGPIAEAGSGTLAVAICLQSAFAAFERTGDGALARLARYYAAISLERGLTAFTLESDRERLMAAVAKNARIRT